MTRTNLHKIFESEYNHQDWLSVLKHTFGAQQLYEQPKQILLPDNNRATEAYELGNLTSSDERIIGLYRINVKPEVWLERNKVSLRELLRNVYKYDVDGAIVVFVQEQKWRLSFISEIKVLNDEGDIVEQATESKRYTYLLGKDEKVKTPSDRLSKLSEKVISLQDILDAFSVESLNEEFYKIIQSFFYKLVGGKVGKDKRAINYGDGILELPNNDQNIRQEFAVRLIGRTVFSWFLKMKKSDLGIALLPEHLLSSKSVKENTNYYHTILERLFFQTLNTPMEERLNNLPDGAENIPFLNGGLFEPNTEDYYKVDNNGINLNDFGISNDWFFNLFEELEKYNFTIDENSVSEIEVSVDPEMLGRIFENLLAEIDPDSGETARKSSGSFYTPREIVDYMATESLVQYIYNKTSIQKERLRPIFKMLESKDQAFTDIEKNSILEALDNVKILDPACGSGAFPMGVLQKIVQALQKLDKDAVWWKNRQIERINNAIVKKQLKEKLESSGIEYARKIGIIQNTLYGVDIQPIASEISKLRCFLSLIVDENIDETKPNRGIEPLPNLEFKFVTANTLVVLPKANSQPELNKRGKKSSAQLEIELNTVRQNYIQSFGKDKQSLKIKFNDIQKDLFNQQGLFGEIENNRYHKISNWKPFANERSDWFDPKWMFGVESFDIVIGNPPYIKEYTNKAAFDGIRDKEYYQGKMDLWYYFACHMLDYLNETGNLTFIATNNWVTNSGASKLRDKVTSQCKIIKLVDFGNTKIFSKADIQTMILIAENNDTEDSYTFDYRHIADNNATLKDAFSMLSKIPSEKYVLSEQIFERKSFKKQDFLFNTSTNNNILNRIEQKQNFKLDEQKEVAQGIVSPQDFLNKKNKSILGDKFKEGQGIFNITHKELNLLRLTEKELKLIKPFYTSNELKRYYGDKNNKLWIIYTDSKFKNETEIIHYPNIKKHLDQFQEIITSSNKPYGLHRARVESFFQGEKIISLRKCSDRPTFTYTNFDSYVSQTYFIIKTNRISLKYLTILLNSDLIRFWLRHKGKMQGFNFQVDKKPLLDIPIFKPIITKPFEIILDYLVLILSNKNSIHPDISNNYLAELLEDIGNAMILEIYFKDIFEIKDIEFIKYVEEDFESIEGKPEDEQIRIINDTYQKLKNKDNKIMINLKLIDIKLGDIVLPIKTI